MSIEVGRNNDHGINQCPICGKDHHCFVTNDSKNYLYYGCNYTFDGSNIKSIIDGYYYIYTGLSLKGVPKYEEANQHYLRTNRNAEANSYKTSTRPQNKVPEKVINFVEPLADSKLHDIYSYILELLCFEDYHRYLLYKDGWTDELIQSSNIRSFPPDDYIRKQNSKIKYKNPSRREIIYKLESKFGDLTGVPGIFLAKQKHGNGRYWKFSLKDSGMLIPQFNMFLEVYRLRFRFDIPPKGKNKYRNISSYYVKKGTNVNVFDKGAQSNSNISFYYDKDCDWSRVAILEGEKKAYITHKLLKIPTISLPGVSTYRKVDAKVITFFKEHGVKILLLGYDADKVSNKDVLKAEKNAIQYLTKFIPTGTIDWLPIWGKGIDDILLKNYMPDFNFPFSS